jgi:hypothetical protein
MNINRNVDSKNSRKYVLSSCIPRSRPSSFLLSRMLLFRSTFISTMSPPIGTQFSRYSSARFTYVECFLVNRIEHFEAVIGRCFLISIYLDNSNVSSVLLSRQGVIDNKLTDLKGERHWHLCNVIHVISCCTMCKISDKGRIKNMNTLALLEVIV